MAVSYQIICKATMITATTRQADCQKPLKIPNSQVVLFMQALTATTIPVKMQITSHIVTQWVEVWLKTKVWRLTNHPLVIAIKSMEISMLIMINHNLDILITHKIRIYPAMQHIVDITVQRIFQTYQCNPTIKPPWIIMLCQVVGAIKIHSYHNN